MTNIVRFDQDGLEILIDTKTGESFASCSGYARMSGKTQSTVSRRLSKLDAQTEVKSLEIETGYGIKLHALIPESLIRKWIIKDNPKLAEQIMAAGTRVFLHGLAGYEHKRSQPKLPQTYLEALEALVKSEREKELVKKEKQLLEQENQQLSEAVDELFDYSSIIRIAKFNNCSEKAFSWRKLKAASKAMDLEIKKVPCPRFEYKCLYSHDVWRFVYPGYKLPETTTLVINV